jgi:hypothetical protein
MGGWVCSLSGFMDLSFIAILVCVQHSFGIGLSAIRLGCLLPPPLGGKPAVLAKRA